MITFGSLFSGGGGLDLGLEQAGMKCTFQVENDKHCLTILGQRWPDVPKNEIRPCMGLVGGDPCPIRSSLANSVQSRKPDLSGYFLAMAARCKPGWILRENVCASDVVDFHAGLQLLGYRTIYIRANSSAFTGQSRGREFLVGFNTDGPLERFATLANEQSIADFDSMRGEKQEAARCLNTRCRSGVSIYQDFIYEGSQRRFRCFSHAERESLQGWPVGWTDGVPDTARERIVGNGVTAPVAKWLGLIIMKAIGRKVETDARNNKGE